jgi:hypothetical protein
MLLCAAEVIASLANERQRLSQADRPMRHNTLMAGRGYLRENEEVDHQRLLD